MDVFCKQRTLIEVSKTMNANSIAEEFICPLSQTLPEDPVIAEDGFFYERRYIEHYIAESTDRSLYLAPVIRWLRWSMCAVLW